MSLKAPFPYFGGKSKVAQIVWDALGQPDRYIEPFFGSGAVLLSRRNFNADKYDEIVNDKDGFIANVWRGLQHDPDEVAKWCDWPVNHADLCARKKRLIENESRLLENLIANDEWYDAKLAGYWIWAASCWIGSGLTRPGQVPELRDGKGVFGVVQIPKNDNVKGVNQSAGLYTWFAALSTRLRRVKVVCGDWNRVCGGNWQDSQGTCGMFFDPPYGVKDRDTTVYHHDSVDVAKDVMAWCAKRGAMRSYRIVLAGYEEYETLVHDHGWTAEAWKANGGYGNMGSGKTAGKENRHRETLYFSPHCHRERLF